jgi:hypothetical protein
MVKYVRTSLKSCRQSTFYIINLEDRVAKTEKNMLKWFSHVEKMDKRKLTKGIYEADLEGNAIKGRTRQTFGPN